MKSFFTFKTTSQIKEEERKVRQRAEHIRTPHGLRTDIETLENEIKVLNEASENFFSDVEIHFGTSAKYLGREYPGRSKLENVTNDHSRRFAMTWQHKVYPADNTMTRYYVGFVYTATTEAVRIDYIVNTISGDEINVTNDNFNPLSPEIHKNLSSNNESFRMVRYYKDHAEFISKQDGLPVWFIKALGDIPLI